MGQGSPRQFHLPGLKETLRERSRENEDAEFCLASEGRGSEGVCPNHRKKYQRGVNFSSVSSPATLTPHSMQNFDSLTLVVVNKDGKEELEETVRVGVCVTANTLEFTRIILEGLWDRGRESKFSFLNSTTKVSIYRNQEPELKMQAASQVAGTLQGDILKVFVCLDA